MIFEQDFGDGRISRKTSAGVINLSVEETGDRKAIEFSDALMSADYDKILFLIKNFPDKIYGKVEVKTEKRGTIKTEDYKSPMLRLLCMPEERVQQQPLGNDVLSYGTTITGYGGRSAFERRSTNAHEDYMSYVAQQRNKSYQEHAQAKANRQKTQEIIEVLNFVLDNGGRITAEGPRIWVQPNEFRELRNDTIRDYISRARAIDEEIEYMLTTNGCYLEEKQNQDYFIEATSRCRKSSDSVENCLKVIKDEIAAAVSPSGMGL